MIICNGKDGIYKWRDVEIVYFEVSMLSKEEMVEKKDEKSREG